eukprot:COSAG02_NODE_13089_length_1447_cov_1.711424_3_plen_23_part_01
MQFGLVVQVLYPGILLRAAMPDH